MKTLEENLDKFSRNKLASFLGMVGTLQSGDLSSKFRDMAKKSYQVNKPVPSVGKLTPKQIELIKRVTNKRK